LTSIKWRCFSPEPTASQEQLLLLASKLLSKGICCSIRIDPQDKTKTKALEIWVFEFLGTEIPIVEKLIKGDHFLFFFLKKKTSW